MKTNARACRCCKIERPVGAFRPRSDGFQENRCIFCDRERSLKYYNKNKKICAIRAKLYREKNKDKLNAKSAEWRAKNKEKRLEYGREYHKKNKVKNNKRHGIYLKKKYKNDPIYKIKHNLRVRIGKILKNMLNRESSIKLLGCSGLYLKEYLESKFVPGMSWDNYGLWDGSNKMTWHVDHIVPCAVFDMFDEKERAKCFHHSNLQPLWAKDNLIKGKNYEF